MRLADCETLRKQKHVMESQASTSGGVSRNNNNKRGAAGESGDAHTKVTRFLDSLKSSEKNFSASRLRQMLARKKNERAKKLALRRKQKERVRKLVRDLETTEAEIVS